MHPLLVEKAKDDSLLAAVEHVGDFPRKTFSVKKGMVLRYGA
jgi:hypothetical protein